MHTSTLYLPGDKFWQYLDVNRLNISRDIFGNLGKRSSPPPSLRKHHWKYIFSLCMEGPDRFRVEVGRNEICCNLTALEAGLSFS